MGFLAIGGLAVALAGMMLCAALVALIVWITIRSTIVRCATWCIGTILLCATVWCYMNRDALFDQLTLYQGYDDCGWREYKTIKNIDGIYIDSYFLDATQQAREIFAKYYPAIEYDQNESVMHQDKFGLSDTQSQRKFRYGVRFIKNVAEKKFLRTETDFVDFDSNEIIAKDVTYSIKENENTFWTIFFLFVQYHASCGAGHEVEHYTHAFQPTGAK
ncbi:MAG: hypothetical protein P4L91_10440 [Burkholderiaceae bacterium]|nr:hypothetical protein [Burkholderiaceae bacterium]